MRSRLFSLIVTLILAGLYCIALNEAVYFKAKFLEEQKLVEEENNDINACNAQFQDCQMGLQICVDLVKNDN